MWGIYLVCFGNWSLQTIVQKNLIQGWNIFVISDLHYTCHLKITRWWLLGREDKTTITNKITIYVTLRCEHIGGPSGIRCQSRRWLVLAGARRCLCVWLSRGLVVGGVDNIEDRPDHPISCYGGVCVGLAAVSSIICTEHQVISLAHLCRNFCSFDPRLYLGDDSNITGPASRTQGPGGPTHHPHTLWSSKLVG